MALFNRNRNQIDQVPVEVQEYYQAERRERTGMAWLLALATLGATIALAAALFYGGKWAYRSIANRNKKPQTVQNTNKQGTQQTATSSPTDNGTPGAPTGTSSTSTNTPSPPPSSAANTGAPQPSSGVTGSSNGTNTTSTSATPNASTQSVRLVNTGASNVVTSFVVVSISGAAVHYAYVVRRARS